MSNEQVGSIIVIDEERRPVGLVQLLALLELLGRLRSELGMAMLLITHDTGRRD